MANGTLPRVALAVGGLPAGFRLRECVGGVLALRPEDEGELPLGLQPALRRAECRAGFTEVQRAQHVLPEVAVVARDALLLCRHEPRESPSPSFLRRSRSCNISSPRARAFPANFTLFISPQFAGCLDKYCCLRVWRRGRPGKAGSLARDLIW